jgi:hypothetical protein
VKLAYALAGVLLLACGGPPPAAAPAPEAPPGPGPRTERALRRDAARLLGCPAAAIALVAVDGGYRVSGCGQGHEYQVVCEAHDVCGFVR